MTSSGAPLPGRTSLIRELHKVARTARRAGLGEAHVFLNQQISALDKTERERSWPLGRCMECWAIHNRLREAIAFDPGGGFEMCEEHLS